MVKFCGSELVNLMPDTPQGCPPLSRRYGYEDRGGYRGNRAHRFYQDDPYDQYHLGAYQNLPPYPGGQPLQGPGPRQATFLDMAQRQIQAVEPGMEMRISLAGTPMPKLIFLRDEEGSAIHFLYLTFSNPASGAADRGACISYCSSPTS